MSLPLKLFTTLSLLCSLVVSSSHAITSRSAVSESNLDSGYTALRLLLEDEQHLTTIRLVKAVIAFEGISEPSKKLIDDIADLSTTSLDELDDLAAHKPAIMFIEFSGEAIGVATLDSLRMTTAKEFLFDNDAFEKNLLISQAQILRVISHLATELADKEPHKERKEWLQQLARQYENFYTLVYKRIDLA